MRKNVEIRSGPPFSLISACRLRTVFEYLDNDRQGKNYTVFERVHHLFAHSKTVISV